jgi:hypothetical protein
VVAFRCCILLGGMVLEASSLVYVCLWLFVGSSACDHHLGVGVLLFPFKSSRGFFVSSFGRGLRVLDG